MQWFRDRPRQQSVHSSGRPSQQGVHAVVQRQATSTECPQFRQAQSTRCTCSGLEIGLVNRVPIVQVGLVNKVYKQWFRDRPRQQSVHSSGRPSQQSVQWFRDRPRQQSVHSSGGLVNKFSSDSFSLVDISCSEVTSGAFRPVQLCVQQFRKSTECLVVQRQESSTG